MVTNPSGTAPAVVSNSNSATVDDKGAATGQSGLVAAQTGPVTAHAGGSGLTDAHSGNASASGLAAQNLVQNGSQAAVQVGGANAAPISLGSTNTVVIQDQGAAAANSGAALAALVPNSTPGAKSAASTTAGTFSVMPVPVADPSLPSSASSSDASATGAVTTNLIQNSVSSTLVAPVGTPSAISIRQTQNIAATSGGQASAGSAGACAGAGCRPAGTAPLTSPVAGPEPVPDPRQSNLANAAQARSGAAAARGAIVQNAVDTRANVQVNVRGENHGVIQVIINSLTSIFNQGTAQATSGAAMAANGPAASPLLPNTTAASGAAAASGSAQTTGAVVNNNVTLHSAAAVTVNGDNYNPINIVLRLTARLVNWGVGQASSGSAQANSTNGAAAQSGSAAATGLQAQNQVSLAASANVDVTGNNYADITIEVDFNTEIKNIGKALAISGSTEAGATPQPAALASGQHAAIRAGAPPVDATLLPDPATGKTGSAGSDASVATNSPSIGVVSGNSKVVGVHDSVIATNVQNSSVAGSGHAPNVVTDAASYTITACGKAVAGSGSTFVNTSTSGAAPAAVLLDPKAHCPTPVPSPSPVPDPSSSSPSTGQGNTPAVNPAGSSDQGAASAPQPGPYGPLSRDNPSQPGWTAPTATSPKGSATGLNLFGNWPGPDRPTTPAQQVPAVSLPRLQPHLVAPADAGPVTSAFRQAAPGYGMVAQPPVTLAQAAQAAVQSSGVSGVNINVAPFGSWPAADRPAMPDPVFRQVSRPVAVAVAVPAPPSAGPALRTIMPRIEVPLTSTVLLVGVLFGALTLVLRWLWQRPAIRTARTAAYAFARPLLAGVIAYTRRGRRWIAQAASLFLVLLLLLIGWKR